MKILFNTYPMAFHTPGGGEIQLQQYRRHLTLEGVEVSLLDLWNPQFKNHDVVHFFSCMSGSLHFCAFVKNIGLPLVVSPNLWITEETKSDYPFDEIRLTLVLADRVICNSNAECDLLATTFNMPREKFFTVYNGIGRRFLQPVDGGIFRKHFEIEGKFVLNVANIEPRKNQLGLIRALKANPELQLVLMGHVRDREYAKACFEEGGEQLRYIGPVDHGSDLLRSAYAACSVFALPSTLETPGLAAIEAFATGAPLVVTSEGCTREYFGAGAAYVNHRDTADIAQAIAKSVDTPRNFLATIVASGNFTWARAMGRLAALYKDPAGLADTAGMCGEFLAIETDDSHLFVWTRPQATFDCRPGVISGSWRTEFGATIDVLIDGELVHQYVDVSTAWTPFSIVVPEKAGAALRSVTVSVSDGSRAIVRGVALRDVEFMDAGEPGVQAFAAFDALLLRSMGFHPIERDAGRCIAWSGTRASFHSRAGCLEFVWRCVRDTVTVDVLVRGKPVRKGILVGQDWSACSLSIEPADGDAFSEVTFVANGSGEGVVSDRSLGVAISELQFHPWTGTDPT